MIDETWCIGCTLCLKVCPVDCIVGAAKSMHTVVAAQCTGCELCIPACPVDCISLQPVTGAATGWAAWSTAQADEASARYAFHRERLARGSREHDARLTGATPGAEPAEGSDAMSTAESAKSQMIAAVLARARAARGR